MFLQQLQSAVHAGTTPPLTPRQQALSDSFDRLFAASDTVATRAALRRGTRAAHAAILDNYLDNRGPNNWIHFTNIGNWGDNALDRASITKSIQYGDGIATAAYYHTFRDQHGTPLDGSRPHGYVLTFTTRLHPEGRPQNPRRSVTLSRPGARYWYCYWPVSPGLSPNPPCGSHRNGLSTVSAVKRLSGSRGW